MSEADNAEWEAVMRAAAGSERSGRLLGMKQEAFEIICRSDDPISTTEIGRQLRQWTGFSDHEVQAAAWSLVAEKEVKWSEPQGEGFRFSSTNRRIGDPWS